MKTLSCRNGHYREEVQSPNPSSHRLIFQSTELAATSPLNQDAEPDAGTSHPGVLGSPEMYRNPKPALMLLRKLQITPVFAGVLIKLITTGLSELIPFLHRTHHTMNFKGDMRIKRLMFFLLIFFLIHKNELIPPWQFQAT